MITGLSYLVAMACLAILLKLAANDGHEIAVGVEVFHYPAVLLWALFLASPIYALIGVAAYVTSAKPLRIGSYVFVTLAVLVNSYAYLYCKKFYIKVAGDTIMVGGLKRKTIPFQVIRKIILIQGGKGSMEMRLLDDHDRLLLKVSSSLQDFIELVGLVKTRTKGKGIILRQRNMWGEWSEMRN